MIKLIKGGSHTWIVIKTSTYKHTLKALWELYISIFIAYAKSNAVNSSPVTAIMTRHPTVSAIRIEIYFGQCTVHNPCPKTLKTFLLWYVVVFQVEFFPSGYWHQFNEPLGSCWTLHPFKSRSNIIFLNKYWNGQLKKKKEQGCSSSISESHSKRGSHFLVVSWKCKRFLRERTEPATD